MIVDKDQVSLTAEGVTTLIRLLRSGENNTIELAGMCKTVLSKKKEMPKVKKMNLLQKNLGVKNVGWIFRCQVMFVNQNNYSMVSTIFGRKIILEKKYIFGGK